MSEEAIEKMRFIMSEEGARTTIPNAIMFEHEGELYIPLKVHFAVIKELKGITKDCMSGGCDEDVVMDKIDKLAGAALT